jgi:hypothetical protein
VNDCTFSPDGHQVASASDDFFVKLWDADTGEEVGTFAGHEDHVTAIAYSRDGSRIASASKDGTLRVWDVESGCESLLVRHRSPLLTCDYSPDDRHLVSASAEGHVMVDDAATGASVHRFLAHLGAVVFCAFAPDGEALVSAGSDHTERIWDVASAAPLATFVAGSPIEAGAIDADGVRVAVASGEGSGVIVLEPQGRTARPPVVTPVRLYRFDERGWETDPSVRCPHCSRRFNLDRAELDVVQAASGRALEVGAGPERGARSLKCPHCQRALRTNTFIAVKSAARPLSARPEIKAGPWCEINQDDYMQWELTCKRCRRSQSWFRTGAERFPEECDYCGFPSSR